MDENRRVSPTTLHTRREVVRGSVKGKVIKRYVEGEKGREGGGKKGRMETGK